MPHCWHIHALTVYHNAVAIVPTWCNRAVRMLLYADIESSFLAARVLSYGVFLLPECRHSLPNATNFYLGIYSSTEAGGVVVCTSTKQKTSKVCCVGFA